LEEIEIIRYEGERRTTKMDVVAREVPFTINLNGTEFVTLLASPEALEDLTIGLLFSSGLLKTADEVQNITIDEEKWLADVSLVNRDVSSDLVFKRMYTSGCGQGTLFYNAIDILHRQKNESKLEVPRKNLLKLMAEFNSSSTGYKRTGGVHYAAVSDGKRIIEMRQDIGRHNAVDKVLGWGVLEEVNLADKIFLVSGRVSSEIVLKIQKTASPVLVSRSAPTNQGVRLARQTNLTLIGFARGQRMNVYSAPERVKN